MPTWYAIVADFKIRLQILGARSGLGKHDIWNGDLASATTRTADIRQFDDVSRASHVTVVLLHASVEFHSTVVSMSYENRLTSRTGGVEGLRLTERLEDFEGF